MAMVVVDGLEMVDVEEQQQGRLPGACHAIDFACQHHLEVASIGQPGQRITTGQLAQRIDQALQPGRAAGFAGRGFMPRLAQQRQRHLESECRRDRSNRCRRRLRIGGWQGFDQSGNQSSSGLRAGRVDVNRKARPLRPLLARGSGQTWLAPERALAACAQPPIDAEFAFAGTDFEQVRKLIYQRACISLNPCKQAMADS